MEVDDIKEEYSSPQRRRQIMLGKWKEKNGTKATYKKLAKILASQDRRYLVEKLCKILMEELPAMMTQKARVQSKTQPSSHNMVFT